MEKEELEQLLKEYLKKHLTLTVHSETYGNFGYDDCRPYKQHTIKVMLGEEVVTEAEFSTGD